MEHPLMTWTSEVVQRVNVQYLMCCGLCLEEPLKQPGKCDLQKQIYAKPNGQAQVLSVGGSATSIWVPDWLCSSVPSVTIL